MNLPSDGQLVPESAELLRLPRWPRDFDPAHWRPSSEDFHPSSQDEEDAKEQGRLARISVWDHSLTTASQAQVFRQKPALVVVIDNRAVIELAQQRDLPQLRTVYEALSPPQNEMAGAAGHAGIEGLGKGTGLTKIQRKELQDDLAARARLLHPIA